jgi:hypothetical protein
MELLVTPDVEAAVPLEAGGRNGLAVGEVVRRIVVAAGMDAEDVVVPFDLAAVHLKEEVQVEPVVDRRAHLV